MDAFHIVYQHSSESYPQNLKGIQINSVCTCSQQKVGAFSPHPTTSFIHVAGKPADFTTSPPDTFPDVT